MESTFRPALLLMLGRALGFAVSFSIPVVLVRIFDQAEFGTYKQLFLIYSTLYGVAQLGMAESLFYFLPMAPRERGRYILNALVALAVAGLACLVLLGTTGASISRWLSNSALSEHVPLLGLFLGLMVISAVLEIVMISHKRYLWASLSYAFSDVLRAALFIIPVLFVQQLEGLLVGAVGFASLRLGAALYYLVREFGGELRPDAALLRRQLAYAVPFEMAVLVEIAQANFHQYAVSYHFDAATFAVYAVGCLQIPLVEFVASSGANVMMVRMTEAIRDGRGAAVVAVWHDTTRKLALVFFPLVGVLVLNAREIIIVLFTESYLASVPIFMVWSSSMLLGTLSVDAVLRVYAQTRFLFGLNVVRLVLVLGLISWFFSAFQLLGGVLVTVLAMCVAKGLGLARMRSLMHVGLSEVLPWRSLASIGAAAGAAGVLTLMLKSGVEMSPFLLLVVTSLVYPVTYVAGLYGFGAFSEDEMVALTSWLGRWVGGSARPKALKRS